MEHLPCYSRRVDSYRNSRVQAYVLDWHSRMDAMIYLSDDLAFHLNSILRCGTQRSPWNYVLPTYVPAMITLYPPVPWYKPNTTISVRIEPDRHLRKVSRDAPGCIHMRIKRRQTLPRAIYRDRRHVGGSDDDRFDLWPPIIHVGGHR